MVDYRTQSNENDWHSIGSIEFWFDFAWLDMSGIIWRRGLLTALHVAVEKFKFLH